MISLSSDQNNSRNCGFCFSHEEPWCYCPFHLTHFTALSPPHLLFAVSQMIYHGSLSWTHTCFRIQAAISCPQSKMTWNSFAFFISFRSGLASLVSVGSCRIFKRMLYRDGALISSCNRMRPADKEDTYSMKNEFYRCNNTCLVCGYFKVSLILRRPQKPTGSRFSQQKKAHIHGFLFTDYWSSYSCLASKWTATDLSREFNTKQHIRTLLYQRYKMERTLIWIRLQKISVLQKPPKCWSALVFHDTKEWHGIVSVLSWWKAVVNPDSPVSHTHFRCALMREPLFAQLVLAPREPDAAVTYWATIFTFHFSTTRSGRKLSGRYCDEITMSFSLSKELQSAGMKEAELMGEMITCHGYKNGWSSEDSLRGRERERDGIFFFFFFLCRTPLR